MTEPADPRTKVARDLSAIIAASHLLEDQAAHHATDSDDPDRILGGDAMGELGPVASLSAWEATFEAAEALGLDTSYAYDQPDDEGQTVLQRLTFWTEAYRAEWNKPKPRPTIASEAEFLRSVLDWCWQHEVKFEDLARDVEAARKQLEDVADARKRWSRRGRVHCTNPECEDKPRLIRVYGDRAKGQPDSWKCPACKWRYDDDAYLRMLESQARSESAQRFVTVAEALHMLRTRAVPERVARRWVAPMEHTDDRCTECGQEWPPSEYAACPGEVGGEPCGGLLEPVWSGDGDALVESFCDLATRRQWCWWPSLWRRYLMRPARKAGAA